MGAGKLIHHSLYAGGIQRKNVIVGERVIGKVAVHKSDTAGIPICQSGENLVVDTKRVLHIDQAGDIPFGNIGAQVSGHPKGQFHIGDVGDVPLFKVPNSSDITAVKHAVYSAQISSFKSTVQIDRKIGGMAGTLKHPTGTGQCIENSHLTEVGGLETGSIEKHALNIGDVDRIEREISNVKIVEIGAVGEGPFKRSVPQISQAVDCVQVLPDIISVMGDVGKIAKSQVFGSASDRHHIELSRSNSVRHFPGALVSARAGLIALPLDICGSAPVNVDIVAFGGVDGKADITLLLIAGDAPDGNKGIGVLTYEVAGTGLGGGAIVVLGLGRRERQIGAEKRQRTQQNVSQ